MSELADRTKQLQEDLKEMNLDDDTDLLTVLDQDSDSSELDEEQKTKKANHAFKTYKDRLKVARGVIEDQAKEIAQAAPKPAEPQVSQPPVDSQQQAQFYVATLQTRAMQKVGIPDPNHPLVQMEIQRQYGLDASQLDRQATAEKDADGIFEKAISAFPQLKDEDKEVIKSELQSLDVLSRADENVIKDKIHTYMGANIDKFTGTKPPKEGTNGDPNTAPAGAAAISGTKAQGSGVSPGEGSPGGEGKAEVKPPNAEELREMKKLGVPLDRPDLYRKAQKKKNKYAPA